MKGNSLKKSSLMSPSPNSGWLHNTPGWFCLDKFYKKIEETMWEWKLWLFLQRGSLNNSIKLMKVHEKCKSHALHSLWNTHLKKKNGCECFEMWGKLSGVWSLKSIIRKSNWEGRSRLSVVSIGISEKSYLHVKLLFYCAGNIFTIIVPKMGTPASNNIPIALQYRVSNFSTTTKTYQTYQKDLGIAQYFLFLIIKVTMTFHSQVGHSNFI